MRLTNDGESRAVSQWHRFISKPIPPSPKAANAKAWQIEEARIRKGFLQNWCTAGGQLAKVVDIFGATTPFMS